MSASDERAARDARAAQPRTDEDAAADRERDAALSAAVGVLTRREIEARIVAPFFRAVAAEIGRERAAELLREVVRRSAREAGQAMREQARRACAAHGQEAAPDLEAFAGQWEPWFRGGALEIEEHERSPERWRFDVTRCRYAEMYRELGLADLGATLSCGRDAALIEGFSDEVVLHRSQTIMEGAPCCDFDYRRQGEAAEAADDEPTTEPELEPPH